MASNPDEFDSTILCWSDVKTMKVVAMRRFWVSAHRWIGLTLGLIIVVLGLSGSVALVWREATEVLDSKFTIAEPGTEWAPVQKIMDELHRAHPQRHEPWVLNLPWGGPQSPIYAVYESPEEKRHKYESPLYVAVNQYTGQIMGEFYWGETLVSWVYNLHSILQAGMTGGKIVGFLGVVFLLIALSGLYLWWPVVRFRKQNFWTTPSSSGSRFEFDLHKLVGFYSAILLIVMSVTGVMIAFPSPTLATLNAVQTFSEQVFDEGSLPIAEAPPGMEPMTYDAFIDRARAVFPDSQLRSLWMPGVGGNEAYGLSMRQPDDRINRFYPETMVWMNQYTGEIITAVDSTAFNASRAVYGMRYAFHGGEAFGNFGRTLVFISGLLPLFFYVTGIRHWLRFRQRKVDSRSD
jgi:uncharacterized iron-regulated membrane protein